MLSSELLGLFVHLRNRYRIYFFSLAYLRIQTSGLDLVQQVGSICDGILFSGHRVRTAERMRSPIGVGCIKVRICIHLILRGWGVCLMINIRTWTRSAGVLALRPGRESHGRANLCCKSTELQKALRFLSLLLVSRLVHPKTYAVSLEYFDEPTL